ncbi:peptidoglycan-binding protein [Streptomyces sp. P9-A2]|uniref:peptidoglycan-binding protein n=1 Tax=Streptomyces sp. P9-A2 TaxID=3072284 RepID=UPI002FCA156C
MSRWKGLPAELDPSVRNLVVRLRRLKDHSGLSLRQLAAKTGYSTSSWERYLGGRSLPPRNAVEALASVTGEDPTRLLAVWEVAAEAWSGRTATAPAGPIAVAVQAGAPPGDQDRAPESAAEPSRAESVGLIDPIGPADPGPAGPGAEPARGWAFHVAVAAGVVAVALTASAVVVLAGRVGTEDARGTAAPPTSSAAPVAVSPPPSLPAYTCRVERIDGLWYAGQSTTRDAIVANGYAGPEVAEVQCLLSRAGYSPGDIDGIFGPMTERAVKRLQVEADLVVDGIVGPHTWGALRG